MATPLEVGDLITCRIWTADTEQAAVNTITYQINTTGVTAATDQDWIESLDTAVESLYKALLNNNAQYRGVQGFITRVAPLTPATVFVNSNAGAGTAGSIALPRQTCGLISWATRFAGPSGRGRLYFPFPSVDEDATDGKPSTGYSTGIGNAGAAMLALVTVSVSGRTASGALVIPHLKRLDLDPSPIISLSASSRWATQRRRGSFGRPNVSPI